MAKLLIWESCLSRAARCLRSVMVLPASRSSLSVLSFTRLCAIVVKRGAPDGVAPRSFSLPLEDRQFGVPGKARLLYVRLMTSRVVWKSDKNTTRGTGSSNYITLRMHASRGVSEHRR